MFSVQYCALSLSRSSSDSFNQNSSSSSSSSLSNQQNSLSTSHCSNHKCQSKHPKTLKRKSSCFSSFSSNSSSSSWLATQIFWSLLLSHYVLRTFGLIGSASLSAISSSVPSADLQCHQLRDNYRFDFALNIQLSPPPQSIVNDRTDSERLNREQFYHYLVTQGGRFYRFTFNSKFEPSIRLDEHYEERHQENDADNHHRSVPPSNEIVPKSVFHTIPYDIGFSLLHRDNKPFYSTVCFVKINKGRLTCVDVDHWRGSVPFRETPRQNDGPGPHFALESPESFRIIENRTNHRFSFKNFVPSVAFQHLAYTEFENSKYVIVFLEQTQRTVGSFDSGPDSIVHFERRMQAYGFNNLNHISNQTDSIVLPDYILSVPDNLEITGVFSWKNNRNNQDEYLILAFNGTSHLYCLNHHCQNLDQYQPYLVNCTVNMANRQARVMHQRPYGEDNNNEQTFGEISENDDDKDVEESKRRHHRFFVLLLLITSGLLGLTLVLLLVGVIYYSVREVKYQEKQIERAYNRNILLQMNTRKILSNPNLDSNQNLYQHHQKMSGLFAPGTPSSNHSTVSMHSMMQQPANQMPILVLIPDNNANFESQPPLLDGATSPQSKQSQGNLSVNSNAICRQTDQKHQNETDNHFSNRSQPTNVGPNKHDQKDGIHAPGDKITTKHKQQQQQLQQTLQPKTTQSALVVQNSNGNKQKQNNNKKNNRINKK